MKRIIFISALMLLTACSPTSTFVQGEVVSCESISRDTNFVGGTELECLDGSTGAQLEALRGPMLVNVWGSWCGPCVEEMPVLRQFYEKANGKVALIGVDVEEANAEDGRSFVESNGITWPNLYDSDGSSRQYFGMGVPVTWFIAADGSVAHKHIGIFNDVEQVVELTKKYLGVTL